jgi:hypothetical protein
VQTTTQLQLAFTILTPHAPHTTHALHVPHTTYALHVPHTTHAPSSHNLSNTSHTPHTHLTLPTLPTLTPALSLPHSHSHTLHSHSSLLTPHSTPTSQTSPHPTHTHTPRTHLTIQPHEIRYDSSLHISIKPMTPGCRSVSASFTLFPTFYLKSEEKGVGKRERVMM